MGSGRRLSVAPASMAAVSSSTRLARMTVEALRVAGVRHVVLCPGSRSAPLAYALDAAGPDISLHVRHDERVAAFTALGAGGAVVTTSGTAAANLHPAVLEAHHSRRPLVVVTADRPPELRGTWANQTSELQARLLRVLTPVVKAMNCPSGERSKLLISSDIPNNGRAADVLPLFGSKSKARRRYERVTFV